jgi:hypothetical protein
VKREGRAEFDATWVERPEQSDVLKQVKYAERWPRFAPLRLVAAAAGSASGLRVAVVLAALVILYLRTPITFTHPQFWNEDELFFTFSRLMGFSNLKMLLAGYLCTAQALVALLATCFRPEFAAAIFCYAAILMTLGVVYLLTSPRLDMPGKPLLAIALVTAPMGWEVLGSLAYCQWVLPVGVFALLFMRPARSRMVLAAEAALVGVTAFTGPFCVLLTPLFVLRTLQVARGEARNRMALFAALTLIGAVTQSLMNATHPQFNNLYALLGVSRPAPWTLWVTLPLDNTIRAFGPIAGFLLTKPWVAPLDVLAALVLAVIAGALAWRQPYRMQKLFMLFFGSAVAASGMWKCRADLATLASGGSRYFYIGDVFALWFLCCLAAGAYSRAAVLTFVAATEILLLPAISGTPNVAADMAWPLWARLIGSGLPVMIPTAPVGWYVGLPPAENGPLAGYRAWLGHPLAEMAKMAPPPACDGFFWHAALFGVSPNLWTVSGTAWPAAASPVADGPVRLVTLVDAAGIVDGFALPGFKASGGVPAGAGWNAMVQAPSGTSLRAYAILGDGRACALAAGRYADAGNPIGGGAFFGPVPLVPGPDIVQAFKPLHRFDRLDVTFAAYSRVPSDYQIAWQIDSFSQGRVFKIGAGTFDADRIRDWAQISLPVSAIPNSVPGVVAVYLRAEGTAPVLPAGVPLFLPASANTDPPASIGGVPMQNGAQVNLVPHYVESNPGQRPPGSIILVR